MNKTRNLQDGLLATECYEQIQDAIIQGIFSPGQKLKVVDLKQRFGVGQSPIREALSRLTQSGLITAEDNKGFYVAPVSLEDILDTYQVFFDIEMMALTRALELGDDVWEAHIVGALHQLSLIENKPEPVAYAEWVKRNYAFHVALISGCNSPLLLQLRAQVYKRFDRYCRISFHLAKEQLHANHQEHKALAEAVLKRDAKEVEALMRHHIFGAQIDVIETLKKNNFI